MCLLIECDTVCFIVWIIKEISGLQQDYINVCLRTNTHTPLMIFVVALYCKCSLFLCSDACNLTLDSNTANTHLILSDENRKVTYVEKKQLYPDLPERFDGWPQVLCRESLNGRCYWEAEWNGYAVIAVTNKGISRKGWNEFSEFGYNRNNRNSWSLICSDSFTACHDNKETVIRVPSCPSKRIGVYVDWPAGTLSFYMVSGTHRLTHLHTFTSIFTESLYAGFGVYRLNSSVSLCTNT